MEKEVKVVRTVSHLSNETQKMVEIEASAVKSFETVRDAIDYLMSVGHKAFVKGFGKIAYRSDKNYVIVSVSFKKSETVAMKFEIDYPWK